MGPHRGLDRWQGWKLKRGGRNSNGEDVELLARAELAKPIDGDRMGSAEDAIKTNLAILRDRVEDQLERRAGQVWRGGMRAK